jgi:hypothetical protein
MDKVFKIITVYLGLFSLLNLGHSAIPTLEGLYRNGINSELAGNLIVAKIKINEITDIKAKKEELLSLDEPKKIENSELPEQTEKIVTPTFVKVLFGIKPNGKVSFLQVNYNKEDFSKSSVSKVKYFKNFERTLIRDESKDRSLVFSLLSMFCLNESKGMATFLKRNNSDFHFNKDLMDNEKVSYFEDLKSYLQLKKKDKEIPKELELAITPEDEEAQQRLKELIKRPMYKDVSQVKLVKWEGKFVWRAQLSNTLAYFSNLEHQIKYFRTKVNKEEMEAFFDDFIVFDGIHQIPRSFIMKNGKNQYFKVNFVSYKTYQQKKLRFNKRVGTYRDILKENKDIKRKANLMFTTQVKKEEESSSSHLVY